MNNIRQTLKKVILVQIFLMIAGFGSQAMAGETDSATCGYIVGLIMMNDEALDDLKSVKSRSLITNNYFRGMRSGTSKTVVKDTLTTVIKKMNSDISRITNKIKKHKASLVALEDEYEDKCVARPAGTVVAPAVNFIQTPIRSYSTDVTLDCDAHGACYSKGR